MDCASGEISHRRQPGPVPSRHGKGTRSHTAGGRLPALVPGSDRQGRTGRQRAGARHHGDPTVRVRTVGADAGRDGCPDQGDGHAERVLPAADPAVVPHPRGRPRRGLRAGTRGRHPRRGQGAGGAYRGPPHLRDDRQRLLLEVGAELPRPAPPHQPVGQRGPLGAAPPSVPADDRVPVAGGPHRTRHLRGRPGLRLPHPPRGLRGLHGERPRDGRRPRSQDRQGAVRRLPSTPSRSKA